MTSARVERIERKGDELVLHKSDKRRSQRVARSSRSDAAETSASLACPGEELDKVYNRLFDPKEFAGQNALVVGGGDSALETAIALTACGAHVTFSYRRKELSRAKPANIEKVEMLGS